MRPSRRKAAEESQRRVRKLLDKDLEAIDDDIVLYEQVHDSDDDSEEKNARKVEKLTTGIMQNSKATYVNKRSKGKTTRRNFSIANTEHVLNQNEATESETDDSEYKPEDHSIENENIDISDGDEIMVISSDAEARRELKKINAPRRSRRTNHSDHSNENENINISDEDEIMINSTDADARNESRRIRASKRSKRTRKIRKTKSKKPGKRSSFGAGTVDLDWQVWEKELQGWEPWGNDGDIDLDALIQKKVPADVREPPPELLMPLLPFQKEWLAWGLKQEGSEFGGGILADEMGMGKTIQAIALILTSRALRQEQTIREKLSPALPNILGTSSTATKVLPQIKATLVVCPLVAVIQWRNEVARFTAEGSTKVLVYHGASRCRDLTELAQYDIVLTTYSIVELEHRKNLMPAKEKCQWCGRLFYPDRLVVHLRFFCGPTAVKSEKQAKQLKKKVKHMVSGKMSKTKPTDKGNVVEDDVCKIRMKGKPKSKGLVKDKGEISVSTSVTRRKRKAEALEVEGDISSCKSFKGKSKGQGRRKGEENMDAHFEDSSECTKEGLSSLGNIGSSFLHSVKWDRIILDEAHFIKDRRCSTSKAVFSLESSYKWALSGTPLQNRVGELYSLIRFLQIYPYSYYFCRRCDCKSLDYSFGKEWRKCDHCGHSPLHHFCWWNKFVANPIKKCGYMFEGRKAMILLKHKVLDSAVLRRTKSERAADLALPPRTAFLRRDTFDAREEDFYQALYTQSQSQFNTYITAGTLLNNYAHIFDLLTRLRQAVDHPYLVVYSGTSASPLDQNNTFDLPSAKEVCGICHDPPEDSVSAGCGHIFCRVCIQEHASTAGQSLCPSCSKPLMVDLTIRKNSNSQQSGIKVNGYRRSSIINRINIENFQTSTKIDALREEIMLMLQKDAAAKAIVFSQFTSFLDLIRFCLQKSGMKCAQLVGNMSIQARDQTIEKFTNDPDCKVFLMSLKAGGVALNLTVASHVFLMDPWWNPAVEQQAQDRIHRIGQYKPIRVVRFVIANTIEERILRLQEKKQLVFEGTVGGSSEALGRLTEDDLRFLFTN